MKLRNSALYQRDIQKIIDLPLPWDKLLGKTVLITGATGLICSAVADILFALNREKGASIHVVLAGRKIDSMKAHFETVDSWEEGKYVFFDASTGEPPAVEGPLDYIIHGAGNAHPAMYTAQPVETMKANLIGLDALLALAVKKEASRLLYISSSEVYGQKKGNEPYSEDEYGYVDICNPRACYPSAKRAAETLCAAYMQEYSLETVAVRPGHVYGPTMTETDSRAASQFARNAAYGENIVMKSAGLQLRSHCYVLDCASAILTVLLRGKAGQAYNISNPDSVSTIAELAGEMARAGNVQVVREAATAQEQQGYNLMDNSSLNSEKLESLGWVGLFSLKQGVEHTVRILREMNDLK